MLTRRTTSLAAMSLAFLGLCLATHHPIHAAPDGIDPETGTPATPPQKVKLGAYDAAYVEQYLAHEAAEDVIRDRQSTPEQQARARVTISKFESNEHNMRMQAVAARIAEQQGIDVSEGVTVSAEQGKVTVNGFDVDSDEFFERLQAYEDTTERMVEIARASHIGMRKGKDNEYTTIAGVPTNINGHDVDPTVLTEDERMAVIEEIEHNVRAFGNIESDEAALITRYKAALTAKTPSREKEAATKPDSGRAEAFSDLRGVKVLSDAAASELAKCAGPTLFLNDVVEISDEALEMLAAREGGLILKGLPRVSVRVAKTLGRHVGTLEIGLTEPSDEIVTLLAGNQGQLGLNAMTALTPAAAKALGATHEGILGLNGVTELSAEAAESLAVHRGTVALTGITTLTPAAASALAKAEYPIYLTDRKAFSDEVRAILSQHDGRIVLTGMDLPQCFEVDQGWFARGDDAQRMISRAIKKAIGEDLPQKEADDLSGVAIHSNLRDYVIEAKTPSEFSEDPRCLIVPAPSDEIHDPDSPTCVRVDSISGRIICVQQIFSGANLGQLAEAVVGRFGKSDKKIDERVIVEPFQTTKYTTVKYTFPNALVRILGILSQDNRGNQKACTHVWICSRPWVEENLDAYGNSVFTSCVWAKSAMDAWDGERFEVARIAALPGTIRREEKVDASTTLLDLHRGRVLEHLGQLLPAEDDDKGRHRWVSATFRHRAVVGLVGTVTTHKHPGKIPFVLVSPMNSTVAGFRPIMSRDVFSGPCNIIGTRANDLLRDVANHIVQSHFEPSTDTITVLRDQNDVLIADWMAHPRLTQIDKEFRSTSEMARFEWVDKNGWTVRVCFDEGQICFFKMPKQAPHDGD